MKRCPPVTSKAAESASPIAASAHRPERRWFFCSTSRATIDAWDPTVVNALAADRPVIAFDNAGVGRSTSQTPDNVAAMARDAVDFINMLGLSEVDLLGFSLGGCVAQQIAAEHGRLVRKLILVGTAPKGGEEHLLAVLREAFSQADAPDPACRCSSRSRPPAGRPAWRS